MNKINVNLENCYGIKKLNFEFDFTSKSTYAIYAPNGIMKTSFAKTFLDLSNGVESKDSIFKERVSLRSIIDETNLELSSEKVFVVLPYAQDFKSTKISTLLVNNGLKRRYEEIHSEIDEKKANLLTELKKLSGIKNGIEEQFSTDFTNIPKEFFRAIGRVKVEVLDRKESEFNSITYQKIFAAKVVDLISARDKTQ